jgi:hypothetical protein
VPEFTFVELRPMDGVKRELDAGVTIGREGCDVVLHDPQVSRRHAALRMADGDPAIEDLGSSNGTFVNGERIEGVRALKLDDVVRLGGTEWVLEEIRPADDASPRVTSISNRIVVDPPPVADPPPMPRAPVTLPPSPPAMDRPRKPGTDPGRKPATDSGRPKPGTDPGRKPPSVTVRSPGPDTGRRGDVPAPPPVTPSAVHRTLSVQQGAPPPFAPAGSLQAGGSAATRSGYTLFCMAFFALTLIALIVYFAVN